MRVHRSIQATLEQGAWDVEPSGGTLSDHIYIYIYI